MFLMGIGGKLKSGQPHDGRAPDYDDWNLNGDILFWDSVNGQAIELSSMGIRVSPESLDRQLTLAGCDSRRSLPFHRMLLNGELPGCPCCCWARPTSVRCRVPCGTPTPSGPVSRPAWCCCDQSILAALSSQTRSLQKFYPRNERAAPAGAALDLFSLIPLCPPALLRTGTIFMCIPAGSAPRWPWPGPPF